MASLPSASISTLERGEYRAVGTEAVDTTERSREYAVRPGLVVAGVASVGALVILAIVVASRGSSGSREDIAKFASTPELKSIVHDINDEINYDDDIALDVLSQTTVAETTSPKPAHVSTRTPTTATTTTKAIATSTSTTASTATSTSDLKPDEERHDGNPCEDGEELFLGLCYKTCSALTQGKYPVRGTPFECCKEYPCDPTVDGQKEKSETPCSGYDVSGKNGCPHKPGACLVDEEYHLGLCYKKCSILTHGTYPHRIAAATCCKGEGVTCLDIIAEDWTSASFNVGGGKGDNDTFTPTNVHVPLQKLTEGTRLDHIDVTGKNLKPKEHMHNGNQCPDGEELHAALCYKTCSSLTNGRYPIRTTAFSCCAKEPCGLFNQEMDGMTPCEGYDVNAQGGCPHSPGACLENEELFLDVCYEKCSTLTEGKFPIRASPMNCCKEEDYECLNPFAKKDESESSYSFDISGGTADRDPVTPGSIHGPLKVLTEAA